jgi:hypothetical protein
MKISDKQDNCRKDDSMPRICLRYSHLWFLPLIILSLLLEFATPAAAQMHGYRYGGQKSGLTQKSQEQENTSQQEAYEKYKLKKEKTNLKRQKNGLEPRPIATFEEWKQGKR